LILFHKILKKLTGIEFGEDLNRVFQSAIGSSDALNKNFVLINKSTTSGVAQYSFSVEAEQTISLPLQSLANAFNGIIPYAKLDTSNSDALQDDVIKESTEYLLINTFNAFKAKTQQLANYFTTVFNSVDEKLLLEALEVADFKKRKRCYHRDFASKAV